MANVVRFVFVALMSILFNNFAACDTYYIDSQSGASMGGSGAGPQGDPGKDGDSCTIIDNGDGTADTVCPEAYTYPGLEGQHGYLSRSMPEFEWGYAEFSGGILQNHHHLSNKDGCGKGYQIMDIRFYLSRFTSATTDMEIDVFLGGISFGTVDCVPLSNGATALIECELLGANVVVAGNEPLEFSSWAYNLPELTTGTIFEFDIRWKDIETGIDGHHMGAVMNRY